jgi:UDP-glucose 4-epimerase
VRALITGGAGFIGANLARALVERGSEVVVVDDLSSGALENLDGVPAEVLQGSILDVDLLERATAGVDAIAHLAAVPSVPRSILDPVRSHEANATGTLRVLEAARRTGAYVVVASSSSVYGRNPTLPKHEDLAPAPMSPYAVSKLATEGYALAYQVSYDLPTLALRFFNVYGPLQAAGHAYAAVVPAFVSAALAGQPVTVFGDGEQSVTALLAEAMARRVTSDRPVNLAFGTRTTLGELIGLLGDLLGSPIEVDHQEPRTGDVRHSQADTTRLAELFPDASPVPLADGLAATIEWFRSGAHPAAAEPVGSD